MATQRDPGEDGLRRRYPLSEEIRDVTRVATSLLAGVASLVVDVHLVAGTFGGLLDGLAAGYVAAWLLCRCSDR